jgi:hypothetical protein
MRRPTRKDLLITRIPEAQLAALRVTPAREISGLLNLTAFE